MGNDIRMITRIIFGSIMGMDEIHGALIINMQLLFKERNFKWRYSHRYAAVVDRRDLLSLKLVNEDEIIRDALNLYRVDLREQYETDDDDDENIEQ